MYKDSSTFISAKKLRLKGLFMPYVSDVAMDVSEIESVEIVSLSPLTRVNMLGTQNLKTWWTFDAARPLKKYGFIVRFPNFKYRLGFTVSNFEPALNELKNALGNKVHDKRANS